MQRTAVSSSMLRSVGFEDGVIEAEFTKGGIYQYEGFTQEDFDKLMAAPSIGKYFREHIMPSSRNVRPS